MTALVLLTVTNACVSAPTGPTFDLPTLVAIVTAGTAVVLAAATFYQALKTGAMVKEMKETRELEYCPQLRGFLAAAGIREVRNGPVVIPLRIMNIGRAPALDIRLTIKFENSGRPTEDRLFKQEVMPAGDHTDVLLPGIPTLESIASRVSRIDITGRYRDADDNPFTIKQSIDVKDFVNTVNKMKITRNLTDIE